MPREDRKEQNMSRDNYTALTLCKKNHEASTIKIKLKLTYHTELFIMIIYSNMISEQIKTKRSESVFVIHYK